MVITMSDEQIHEFEKHLDTLKWVVAVGWALLAGAFGIGIWVATLEIRCSAFSDKIMEHEVNIKNHGSELNGMAVRQAVNSNDLAYIKATVDRIEKTVKP